MKNILLVCIVFLCSIGLNAQLKSKLLGKLSFKVHVTSELTNFEDANKQVLENTEKYNWLNDGVFNFKKNDLFEVKLKSGKTEKGRYTADDSRVILIFDNEEIEEFNTTNPKIENNKIILPFGRRMTKVTLELSK